LNPQPATAPDAPLPFGGSLVGPLEISEAPAPARGLSKRLKSWSDSTFRRVIDPLVSLILLAMTLVFIQRTGE
jgi:hypothetical protein